MVLIEWFGNFWIENKKIYFVKKNESFYVSLSISLTCEYLFKGR